MFVDNCGYCNVLFVYGDLKCVLVELVDCFEGCLLVDLWFVFDFVVVCEEVVVDVLKGFGLYKKFVDML